MITDGLPFSKAVTVSMLSPGVHVSSESNTTAPHASISEEVVRVQNRRQTLIRERQAALGRGDFEAANEITRRLVKLPVPMVRQGVVVLNYGA